MSWSELVSRVFVASKRSPLVWFVWLASTLFGKIVPPLWTRGPAWCVVEIGETAVFLCLSVLLIRAAWMHVAAERIDVRSTTARLFRSAWTLFLAQIMILATGALCILVVAAAFFALEAVTAPEAPAGVALSPLVIGTGISLIAFALLMGAANAAVSIAAAVDARGARAALDAGLAALRRHFLPFLATCLLRALPPGLSIAALFSLALRNATFLRLPLLTVLPGVAGFIIGPPVQIAQVLLFLDATGQNQSSVTIPPWIVGSAVSVDPGTAPVPAAEKDAG